MHQFENRRFDIWKKLTSLNNSWNEIYVIWDIWYEMGYMLFIQNGSLLLVLLCTWNINILIASVCLGKVLHHVSAPCNTGYIKSVLLQILQSFIHIMRECETWESQFEIWKIRNSKDCQLLKNEWISPIAQHADYIYHPTKLCKRLDLSFTLTTKLAMMDDKTRLHG